jgi:hypothetical protein
MAILTFLLLRFWQRNEVIRLVKLFLTIWLIAALVIILDYTDFFFKFYRFIGFGHYVKPLGIVLSHSLGGHTSCFEGSFITCDWRYFFGVMAIRTPVLALGLFILGFLLLLRSKFSILLKCVLIAPIIFFLGAAVLNKINIGIRHILPVYPFLFVLGGVPGAVLVDAKNKTLRIALGGVLLVALSLLAIRTLKAAPDYLVCFNEFIGGPEQGARHMPINWGQDNKRLSEFVLRKGIPFIKIDSGQLNADVYDYYKINWKTMGVKDVNDPAPGFYALDIGAFLREQKDPNSWFYGKRPMHRVGKTFFVFEVPGNLNYQSLLAEDSR